MQTARQPAVPRPNQTKNAPAALTTTKRALPVPLPESDRALKESSEEESSDESESSPSEPTENDYVDDGEESYVDDASSSSRGSSCASDTEEAPAIAVAAAMPPAVPLAEALRQIAQPQSVMAPPAPRVPAAAAAAEARPAAVPKVAAAELPPLPPLSDEAKQLHLTCSQLTPHPSRIHRLDKYEDAQRRWVLLGRRVQWSRTVSEWFHPPPPELGDLHPLRDAYEFGDDMEDLILYDHFVRRHKTMLACTAQTLESFRREFESKFGHLTRREFRQAKADSRMHEDKKQGGCFAAAKAASRCGVSLVL